MSKGMFSFLEFLLQMETKRITEPLKDSDRVNLIQEELHQFERNKVWHMVPRLSGMTIIGAMWVLRKKLDELATPSGTRPGSLFKGRKDRL